MRWLVPLIVLLAGCAMPVEQQWIDVQRVVTVSGGGLGSSQGAHCAQADFHEDALTVRQHDGRKAPAVVTERFATSPNSSGFATTGLEATAHPLYDGQTHILESMFGHLALATISWDDGMGTVDGTPIGPGWSATFDYQYDGINVTESFSVTQSQTTATWHRPGMCM